MATGAATERQQEVLDLINDGKTVAEMAKALKLTENGVRSHIKRLKARGLVPKSYASRGGGRRRGRGRGRGRAATTAAASNRSTAVARSNGSVHLDGIPALDEAIKQMAARQQELTDERDSIDARAEELAAEQAVLRERKITVEGEVDQLQRVEKALETAVA
ncbi:MAG: Bacterial regulatory protein luxR family [Microbacteriaceae bacterium]|jgi:predicted ArsR family transcriptional regulator|nr:Bacterial regulatory protein luxR family [Microbacteriaceae bacterium]